MNKLEIYIINHLKKYYNELIIKKRKKDISVEDFYGSELLSPEDGNKKIGDLIESSAPFIVARFGSVELAVIYNYIQIQGFENANKLGKYLKLIKGDINYWHESLKKKSLSVIPSDDEDLAKFSELFIKHACNIDVLGAWLFNNEKYFHRHYFPKASLVPLSSIEPYYFSDPWSKKLEGKKVLVVHPFEDSIIHQYRRREFLFDNKNILPEFDLQTLKTVFNLSDKKILYSQWFEEYEQMCEGITKKDFDIAIIGAGPYGLPLCSFVKSLGKKAIQMGGATQIFFGIKGKRWDIHSKFIRDLYNDDWNRPLPSETPENFRLIDDGCYW